MVDIKPFAAWRYNTLKVNLSDVIAPPYDVIDAAEQETLYARSAENIVRLILGKDEPLDRPEGPNKYLRERTYMEAWRKEAVLIKESEPTFYAYRKTYPHPDTGHPVERLGFFALLKLEDFSQKKVLPHEQTHLAPKVDRMHLIRAVRGNLSPVFGLYEDPEFKLAPYFKKAFHASPLISTVDDRKIKHELWTITNGMDQAAVASFFKQQSIMIADGHHRYETALAYRDEVRKARSIPSTPQNVIVARTSGEAAGAEQSQSGISETASSPEADPPLAEAKSGSSARSDTVSSDYVLAVLVNMYDAGLLVFPTHRLLALKSLPEPAALRTMLQEFFHVKSLKDSRRGDWESALEKNHAQGVSVGMYMGKSASYILTLKDPHEARAFMPAGKSDTWYNLDVNVVSYILIRKVLAVGEPHFEESVSYTRDLDDALARVNEKKAAVAFIMNPPRVEQVKAICWAGETMPQKSTYFYPKLPSGLLLHLHERSL